jgi:hypothetical protein
MYQNLKNLMVEPEVTQLKETITTARNMILNRLHECQMMQDRVEALETPQTKAGEELIKKEETEEHELFDLHQQKRAMYGKRILKKKRKPSHF